METVSAEKGGGVTYEAHEFVDMARFFRTKSEADASATEERGA